MTDPIWRPGTFGSGKLEPTGTGLRCVLPAADGSAYNDAQISDYHQHDFSWRPPLRLTVRAWASHPTAQLTGTAGFGFWNQPFVPGRFSLPRLPRAAWFFFGSPPNDMALARDVPGWGWKAATLDATRLPFLLLAPFAPVGFLLMRSPALYRHLWPVGQWAVGASEALLPVDLAEPHTYELDWLPHAVTFRVDDQPVHYSPFSPHGPLGFIAWMDNQYAVVTPQGRFRFGLLPITGPQWLALDHITIRAL